MPSSARATGRKSPTRRFPIATRQSGGIIVGLCAIFPPIPRIRAIPVWATPPGQRWRQIMSQSFTQRFAQAATIAEQAATKLRTFATGGPDETVTTKTGPLETVSGLVKHWKGRFGALHLNWSTQLQQLHRQWEDRLEQKLRDWQPNIERSLLTSLRQSLEPDIRSAVEDLKKLTLLKSENLGDVPDKTTAKRKPAHQHHRRRNTDARARKCDPPASGRQSLVHRPYRRSRIAVGTGNLSDGVLGNRCKRTKPHPPKCIVRRPRNSDGTGDIFIRHFSSAIDYRTFPAWTRVGSIRQKIFQTSGTFDVPSGTYRLEVEVASAGGFGTTRGGNSSFNRIVVPGGGQSGNSAWLVDTQETRKRMSDIRYLPKRGPVAVGNWKTPAGNGELLVFRYLARPEERISIVVGGNPAATNKHHQWSTGWVKIQW